MPSPFTASFASAASGNSANEGGANGRSTGSGDWSRARTNGATATFRRPSAINTSQREAGQSGIHPPASTSAYLPPHANPNYQLSYGRSGYSSETRYSKDQLLDMFKAHEKNEQTIPNISDYLMEGWAPGGVNGNENGGWGKKDEYRESAGTDICWDLGGNVKPISLTVMDDEERELFSSSVNSALKPATTNKDSTPREGLNRRTSLTQSQSMNDSPSTRPGGRRRDSSDILRSGNPMSPSGSNRFSRDEGSIASPPPSLLRRKTGNADTFGPSLEDRDVNGSRPNIDAASPFGPLKRTNTNPVNTGLNGPGSLWSNAPQSAGFAPMGAFGNFTSFENAEKKPGFASARAQSRFKDLMSAGISDENSNSNSNSKPGLDSLAETTSEQSGLRWGPGRSKQSSKDLYGDGEDLPGGSATLGGEDASPPMPQSSRLRNLDQKTSYDDIGFSSLGLGSDMQPFQQRRDFSHQQTPQQNSGMGQPHDPISPTSTDPYQSPEGDRAVPVDNDTDDDMHHAQYPGASGFGQGGRNLQHQFDSHDRSQTSSTKGFPNIGGLSNLSGLGSVGPWSAAPGAIGTPSRANAPQSAGFNDSFGPFGDLNSAGLSGAGFLVSGAPSGSNVGTLGSRSKLGALFPSAMQDQMLGDTSRQDQAFGDGDNLQRNAPGFGSGFRDTDSPRLRGNKLDDMLNSESRGQAGYSSSFEHESSQPPTSASIQTPFSAGALPSSYFARSQEPDMPGASNQLPASQQRQMVMPDRMRWIYRDPQGNTQGPWSGLEMHDWYKAGFFSPELQVKKLEDADYEPLAQLIRRIGNSREPFLVPQIGIPHGSSAPQPSATATAPAATPSATQSSSAQPPFAGSFPSFGTTLTAEQQNALERRKQEEQYLMARQKEHLAAQQQVMMKQMHMQGGIHGQQLHHQSSGQSLHSQPSFGSITTPGYQPSPAQGPIQPPSSVPGFFEGMPRNVGPLGVDQMGSLRKEEMPGFMERLQMGRGAQLPFGGGHNMDHQQQVNAMLQERARQQREQEQFELLHRSDDPRSAERLEQYQQLRAQEDEPMFQQPGPISGGRQPGQQLMQDQYQDQSHPALDQRATEQLSLSEQVQKAAAKQPPQAAQPQSPWAKLDTSMPQPFPPPQSISPMPAPTPQRNRQSVADALNAESQSPSQTDSAETPSAAIAPWAKDNNESLKGPSLKEIQAMEAKQVAQHEEIQAATRRAMLEQERMIQKSEPMAPAPGLPSSANWANSVSPAIPAGTSAWANPAAGKPSIATPVSGAKKTLAQIQKEEEGRKNRTAAAAAAANAPNTANAPPSAGGKRYADLASKNAPAQTPNNAAWTTVGASGKAKTPAPAPSIAPRTASGNITQPPPGAPKSKVTATSAARTTSTQQNANDELQKWTKTSLNKGLNAGINIDDFITTLFDLPAEPEIISDSVYAASSTIDGRRFAEEFTRRRKLADRGVIPDSPASNFFSASNSGESKNGGGGWSEVAKKGGVSGGAGAGIAEKEAPGFKVVSGKKKGGKR